VTTKQKVKYNNKEHLFTGKQFYSSFALNTPRMVTTQHLRHSKSDITLHRKRKQNKLEQKRQSLRFLDVIFISGS